MSFDALFFKFSNMRLENENLFFFMTFCESAVRKNLSVASYSPVW